jgi:hypothetical protein
MYQAIKTTASFVEKNMHCQRVLIVFESYSESSCCFFCDEQKT